MRLFSSFDSHLKKEYISEFSDRYGEDNIVIIERSNLYFFKKVIFHIITAIVIFIFIVWSIYLLLGKNSTIQYGWRIGGLFSLIPLIIAAENYIDYTMNYAIFTPDESILVEQIGFFRRTIKSLDSRKIKSISIRKSNFIYSLFNDGMISILSEGNNREGMGELIFKYVHNPESVESHIHKVITLHQTSYSHDND